MKMALYVIFLPNPLPSPIMKGEQFRQVPTEEQPAKYQTSSPQTVKVITNKKVSSHQTPNL